LKKEVPAARIVLQIHDELIVETPVAETEKVKALLSEEMSAAFPLAVPLVAEATAGSNWLEAHA
jgi:DNA polymerase-1